MNWNEEQAYGEAKQREFERERAENEQDAQAYAETLAYLTKVGARGHDVNGDATQGIASLVEDIEELKAERQALRDLLTATRFYLPQHELAGNSVWPHPLRQSIEHILGLTAKEAK